jgi:outer membrane receptor protein involved in Fe transport
MGILFSFSAFAQSGLVITVKDSNGAVVPGAAVTISGGSVLTSLAQTDAEGKVTFSEPRSGNVTITAEAAGFPKAVKTVQLNGGQQVEIVLVPGGLSETVNVTAARTQISNEDTAVPVSVVDREEIDKKGINVIGDIFRTLPGTSTVNEGAFQVRPRIRGLDSNRVLILVDGERLNNSRTSTAQSGIETGLVETSQIESVEVVRGSGSVLYGTDALGGTINIITKDTPARRDGGFRFGGSLDTFYSSN